MVINQSLFLNEMFTFLYPGNVDLKFQKFGTTPRTIYVTYRNEGGVTNQTISYWVPKMEVGKYGRLYNITTVNAWNITAGQSLYMDAKDSTDKSGRLVWTGTNFDCQRISDQPSTTWGDVAHSKAGTTVTLGHIPNITVNQYGELTFSANAVNIIDGAGIAIAADGTISIIGTGTDGITVDTDGIHINIGYGINIIGDAVAINLGAANCNAAGTGLYWTGNGGTFGCNTPYSWNLAATGTAGSNAMGHNSTATFSAGTGLSVSRSGAGITYAVDLAGMAPADCLNDTYTRPRVRFNAAGTAFRCVEDYDTNTTYSASGDGMFSLSGTTFTAKSCTDGQILKVSSGAWACGSDAVGSSGGGAGSLQDQVYHPGNAYMTGQCGDAVVARMDGQYQEIYLFLHQVDGTCTFYAAGNANTDIPGDPIVPGASFHYW
jgi:hypothetical protein